MIAEPPRLAVTPGDHFPPVELRTWRNRPTTLAPRSTIVIFYRGYWCGYCREQLIDISSQIDTFRALDITLVAISTDDYVGANNMHHDTRGAIDVHSDPDATVIQRFGLTDRDEKVDHIIARPTVFIIDADGIIRYRYVSRSAADRPTSALLVLAAESLTLTGRKESTIA